MDRNAEVSIQDEIDLLRINIRRVAMFAKGVDNPEEAVFVLRALGHASTQLSTLLHSQLALREESGKSTDVIALALSEVMKEFNLR